MAHGRARLLPFGGPNRICLRVDIQAVDPRMGTADRVDQAWVCECRTGRRREHTEADAKRFSCQMIYAGPLLTGTVMVIVQAYYVRRLYAVSLAGDDRILDNRLIRDRSNS